MHLIKVLRGEKVMQSMKRVLGLSLVLMSSTAFAESNRWVNEMNAKSQNVPTFSDSQTATSPALANGKSTTGSTNSGSTLSNLLKAPSLNIRSE
jgi:hypothetical protein